jgi:hypothetical protein
MRTNKNQYCHIFCMPYICGMLRIKKALRVLGNYMYMDIQFSHVFKKEHFERLSW